MLIIRPGKINKKELNKTICPNCECKFRFSDKDINIDWASIIPELYVTCPWCKENLEVI